MFDFSQLLSKSKANGPVDNMLADYDQRLTLARNQFRGWIIFIETERRRLVHILQVIGDTSGASGPGTPLDDTAAMPAEDAQAEATISKTGSEIPNWDPVPTPPLSEPAGNELFSPFDLPPQDEPPTLETDQPLIIPEPPIQPDDTRPGPVLQSPLAVDQGLTSSAKVELDEDYTPPEQGMLAAFQAANCSHDISAGDPVESVAGRFLAIDEPDIPIS